MNLILAGTFYCFICSFLLTNYIKLFSGNPLVGKISCETVWIHVLAREKRNKFWRLVLHHLMRFCMYDCWICKGGINYWLIWGNLTYIYNLLHGTPMKWVALKKEKPIHSFYFLFVHIKNTSISLHVLIFPTKFKGRSLCITIAYNVLLSSILNWSSLRNVIIPLQKSFGGVSTL